MEVLACKKCHGTASVLPSTPKIRCSGCQRLISVSSGMSKDEDKVVCHIDKRISSNPPSATVYFNPGSARTSARAPQGKRALLCGVSYKNTKFGLKGTTQDVMSMAELLIQKFNFPSDSILILAEDGPYELPTKSNILQAFEWLMRGSQSGDSLVFYYAGHGQRQYEIDGDEIDSFDEGMCPLDFETEGLILDNQINDIIVRPLKPGVVLHAIIDACHSGTVLDLSFVYDCNNRWKGNHPPSGVFKGTSGGLAICLSACRDHQQAADTSVFSRERTMTGAMTHNFKQAIMDNPGITYLGILRYIGIAIETADSNLQRRSAISRMLGIFCRRILLQDLVLSSSKVFDVNRPFKL